MMTRSLKSVAFGLLASTAIVSPAFAQTQPVEDTTQSPAPGTNATDVTGETAQQQVARDGEVPDSTEIIVTAQKREENLQDVPISVQAIGTRRLSALMSRRAYRSARQLGARGAVGVALLRLTSIASGGSIHLVCGAARVPFGAYLLGSIVGLTPVMIVLSAVGSLIRTAFLRPSGSTVTLAAAGVLATGALAFGVRSLLLIRQFAPSVRRHREGAEFG